MPRFVRDDIDEVVDTRILRNMNPILGRPIPCVAQVNALSDAPKMMRPESSREARLLFSRPELRGRPSGPRSKLRQAAPNPLHGSGQAPSLRPQALPISGGGSLGALFRPQGNEPHAATWQQMRASSHPALYDPAGD